MGKPKVVTKFQTHHKSINTYLNLLITSLRLSSNRAHIFSAICHHPHSSLHHPPLLVLLTLHRAASLPFPSLSVSTCFTKPNGQPLRLPRNPTREEKTHKAPPQPATAIQYQQPVDPYPILQKREARRRFDPRTSSRRRDSVPAAPAERFFAL